MTEIDKIKLESNELPRQGSVMYDFHFQERTLKIMKLKRWQRLNKYLMIPLYRVGLLPLLGFGWVILILTTLGWQSRKKRRTPLEYRRFDGVITIFSAMGENSVWVKNLYANPDKVSVWHGFHRYKPYIEFISEESQKVSIIKNYVVKYPKSAKILFGWNPNDDDPELVDFTNLLSLTSIIKLHKKKA